MFIVYFGPWHENHLNTNSKNNHRMFNKRRKVEKNNNWAELKGKLFFHFSFPSRTSFVCKKFLPSIFLFNWIWKMKLQRLDSCLVVCSCISKSVSVFMATHENQVWLRKTFYPLWLSSFFIIFMPPKVLISSKKKEIKMFREISISFWKVMNKFSK